MGAGWLGRQLQVFPRQPRCVIGALTADRGTLRLVQPGLSQPALLPLPGPGVLAVLLELLFRFLERSMTAR